MAHHTQWIAIAVVWLTGCGSVDPQPQPCRQSLGNDYLPFEANLEWKYEVSDAARDVQLGEKTNTIIDVDGDTIRLEVGGVLRPGVRWLRADGSRYEWLRNLYVDPKTAQPLSDQYYEPSALRFDASQRTLDESWQESTYEKISVDVGKCPGWDESRGRDNVDECPAEAITTEAVTETWTVIAVDEALSSVQRRLEPSRQVEGVPAGDFSVLCHERRCEAETCTTGVYCFSSGVGKVFELSAEREELTSVCF